MKFKSVFGTALLAATAMIAASCSDDNNDSNELVFELNTATTPLVDEDSYPTHTNDYSNRSFGQTAINNCSDLVTALEAANRMIGTARLSEPQEAYLREVLKNLVDNVIVPTYTDLADNTANLEAELKGLDVNTVTQNDINNACETFKKTRLYWERSEAFLGGAASDFDIDPTIDSWPLNRSLLLNYFNSGTMDEDMLDDASILGFHALEFILFRNGQPRQVAEFQGNDTYKNFTGVSGAKELVYAQQVCKLLKERTFQLQVAWEGETAQNAERVAVVKAAGLDYTTKKNLSYGNNLKQAGQANSTFATLKDAIAQVLSDDEGSAAAIATEVGTAKIANPFTAGYIFYVESPYSYNSITDFRDNIRSIRNIWLGSTDRTANRYSFHTFFASVGKETTNTAVEGGYVNAIAAISNMPSPFVKYCSTIWNLPYEDDDRTADDMEEE
ncbi:MAG: imelysin [Bacteroidaceae bacterium]|nr:imelysin [Bacteroidaceae bacterium]